MNEALAIKAVVDIHIHPNRIHPLVPNQAPRASVSRTVRCDVLSVQQSELDANPILQVFFHHGQGADEDVAIAILADQLLEGINAIRTNALNRAADRDQTKLDELVNGPVSPV